MSSLWGITYPRPLNKGDRIAVTAPSSGLGPEHYPRLELVIQHLRNQGYQVVEGQCLRSRVKHVSGPKHERAQDFMTLWEDDSIAAIMPPWGGALMIEILPLLDFDRIRGARPKWISGFSDVSTLMFSMTLKTGIATAHGSNLMDLAPTQKDPLTMGLMKTLSLPPGEKWVQQSSEKYQKQWNDFAKQIDTPLNLTEPTEWKGLQTQFQTRATFHGRLIGGCIDTIAHLVGTPFGNLPDYKDNFRPEGTIFYFENCELPPCELARTLWNLRLAGWFDDLRGMMIGRSSGPDASTEANLSYEEVLHTALGDLSFPIIYDVDIGHCPPNLTLINGALAEVRLEGNRGSVTQILK